MPRKRNKVKDALSNKKWLEANRERRAAYTREYNKTYYKKNRAKIMEYQKAYKRKNADRDREKTTRMAKARRVANSRYILEYKASQGCATCGFSDSRALDFHHKDPASKAFNIGTGKFRTQSLDNLKAEIAKCVVLCSNCHRILHAAEQDRDCVS